jgi:hypothetical protein
MILGAFSRRTKTQFADALRANCVGPICPNIVPKLLLLIVDETNSTEQTPAINNATWR